MIAKLSIKLYLHKHGNLLLSVKNTVNYTECLTG